VCCNALQCEPTDAGACVAELCSVLQCEAIDAGPCVAVFCSVLQCVAANAGARVAAAVAATFSSGLAGYLRGDGWHNFSKVSPVVIFT